MFGVADTIFGCDWNGRISSYIFIYLEEHRELESNSFFALMSLGIYVPLARL